MIEGVEGREQLAHQSRLQDAHTLVMIGHEAHVVVDAVYTHFAARDDRHVRTSAFPRLEFLERGRVRQIGIDRRRSCWSQVGKHLVFENSIPGMEGFP